MATQMGRNPIGSGSLTNDEAAALIEMILANTNTSAPTRPQVPEPSRFLSDYFPVAVRAGVGAV